MVKLCFCCVVLFINIIHIVHILETIRSRIITIYDTCGIRMIEHGIKFAKQGDNKVL